MEEKLLEIFPEFLWIKDENLRNQCIKTWCDAMKEGGWDADTVCKLPFVITELKECPVLLVEHVKTVTKTAAMVTELFIERYGDVPVRPDWDVVIAGALLHDIGKLVEYEPDGDKWIRFRFLLFLCLSLRAT